MENIGENQGTSRKITAFFLDVSVLPSTFDALKRLGKTGGLERMARRLANNRNSEKERKTSNREDGKNRKDRSSERTVFNGANANRRRRNREENGVAERLLAV